MGGYYAGTNHSIFLISKKVVLKKRKAPLSTHEVYTRTVKAAYKKKKNPTNPQTQTLKKHLPPPHIEPCLSYAEWTHLHRRS